MGMTFVGGLPETRCGAGSTVGFTTNVRSELRGLLDEFCVKTLLDAPCGDCNWIHRIDLSGIAYLGVDNDEENLLVAVQRMDAGTFVQLDLVENVPPTADLMLCRDFLQHLPNREAWKVLDNFCESRTEWLLVTSHENQQNEDIRRIGDFRPLNLTAAPFNLSSPVRSIPDGTSRSLSLWNASSILRRMSKAH